MKRLLSLIMIFITALMLNTCASRDSLPSPDCIALLIDAAEEGNIKKGRQAEELQYKLLEENPGAFTPVSYEDLLLLSKFICADTEGRLQSDEYLLCTGEIILNRVNSPEFPDSIKSVIYDSGQYSFVNTSDFENLRPTENCVRAALRLLQGERLMKSSVVFKSQKELGKVYASFCDRVQGFIYFCESPNTEAYTIQNFPKNESSQLSYAPGSPGVSVSPDSFRDYKDSSIIVFSDKYS